MGLVAAVPGTGLAFLLLLPPELSWFPGMWNLAFVGQVVVVAQTAAVRVVDHFAAVQVRRKSLVGAGESVRVGSLGQEEDTTQEERRMEACRDSLQSLQEEDHGSQDLADLLDHQTAAVAADIDCIGYREEMKVVVVVVERGADLDLEEGHFVGKVVNRSIARLRVSADHSYGR